MNRKIVLSILTCTVLFSGIFIVNSMTEHSSASYEAAMSVVPVNISYICRNIVDVGDTFTVNITIANVTTLWYAWEIGVYFDPTILTTSIDEVRLPSDHVFAGKRVWEVEPIVDLDFGFVLYGVSLSGDQDCSKEEGRLCQINFTAIAKGVSPIELDDEDSYLCDYPDLNVIPCIKNGTFIDVGSTLPWIYTDCESGGTCGRVAIEPSYLAFVFSCPNKIEFTVSLDSTEQCNVTIPQLKNDITVWDGPFEVRVDGNRVNHTVSFNATNTFLRFGYDAGVHEIEVIEGTLMCVFGDLNEDKVVDIKDLFAVAKNWQKTCETP